ncbi:helix-turn-helix domain-containing protein [Burkholderia sp. S171]|uniref:helix-turn-helix domain-containing protein n=1 Tax=Burkholderia sp. S171 TaxID=1641860 RepID=UPI00131C059B|nr:helix-turn-helix domain-containing protein [Burkholderia sp. S171]
MNDKKLVIQAIVDRMKVVVGVSKDVELADALGVSRSQVAVWKIRDRMPLSECVTIAEQHKVSLDWLVLGRGQPGIEEPESALQSANIQAGPDSYKEIPAFDLAGFLDDGKPQLAVRLPCEWLRDEGICDGDLFALRMQGSSMAPTMVTGDVLLVDRQDREIDGVYVVRFADSIRVRRVQRMHDGALKLMNDNPNYPCETLDANQAEQVEFIGYCVGNLRYAR